MFNPKLAAMNPSKVHVIVLIQAALAVTMLVPHVIPVPPHLKAMHRCAELTTYALMDTIRNWNAPAISIIVQLIMDARTDRLLRQLRAAIAVSMPIRVSLMLPIRTIAANSTTATVMVRGVP